jgi:hypothetical protein
MPQDLAKLIDKIKASAVQRCSDRIDLAARKARELLNTNNTENRKESPPGPETPRVTSILKKRHGL